jgi:hypothetical protein
MKEMKWIQGWLDGADRPLRVTNPATNMKKWHHYYLYASRSGVSAGNAKTCSTTDLVWDSLPSMFKAQLLLQLTDNLLTNVLSRIEV